MNKQALWELIREAWRALSLHLNPIVEHLSEESGLNGIDQGMLLAALTFEPETISPPRLRVRMPYVAAERYRKLLANIANRGYLTEVAPGEYRLTETGHHEAERFITEIRSAMAEDDPLAPTESQRLANLSGRLAEACLNTPPPPDTWSTRYSYRLMPALDPPLPYTEQAFTCLGGYRDDAHLAAWQSTGLSATALETLTYLWRGEADSLDTLCEQLAHREHPRQVYVDALADLRERGFVEGADESLQVSKASKAYRDAIEAKTDAYFFAPWACLSDDEMKELSDIATHLRDGLKVDPGDRQ